MVYVLAYAGLRYGECAALRVGDVDVARRRLRISRSVTYVTGTGDVEGTTKTHASRTVPVPQFLADRLAEAIKGRGPGERLFPCEGYDAMPLDYFRWRFDKAANAALAGPLEPAADAIIIDIHSPITTSRNRLGSTQWQ